MSLVTHPPQEANREEEGELTSGPWQQSLPDPGLAHMGLSTLGPVCGPPAAGLKEEPGV